MLLFLRLSDHSAAPSPGHRRRPLLPREEVGLDRLPQGHLLPPLCGHHAVAIGAGGILQITLANLFPSQT